VGAAEAIARAGDDGDAIVEAQIGHDWVFRVFVACGTLG
jgi:hypothetical protein